MMRVIVRWKRASQAPKQEITVNPTKEQAIFVNSSKEQASQKLAKIIRKYLNSSLYRVMYKHFAKWSIRRGVVQSADVTLANIPMTPTRKTTLAQRVRESIPTNEKNYKYKLKLLTVKVLGHIFNQSNLKTKSEALKRIRDLPNKTNNCLVNLPAIFKALENVTKKAKREILQQLKVHEKSLASEWWMLSSLQEESENISVHFNTVSNNTAISKNSSFNHFGDTNGSKNSSFSLKQSQLNPFQVFRKYISNRNSEVPTNIDVNKIVFLR